MTDTEKLIRALERAKQQSADNGIDRIIVPFKETDMILELLKEKETKDQCLKTKCTICPHCDNCDVDENGNVVNGMNDREKVIKGLLCIKGDFIPCASCKYATAEGYGRGDRCKRQCASDAIAMLKEKEPMTVRLATTADMEKWEKDGMIPATCRSCGEVVLYPSKFFKKDELANYECPDCKKAAQTVRNWINEMCEIV